MIINDYIENIILYVRNFILEFLHINSIIAELNILHNKIIELENQKYEHFPENNTEIKNVNLMYPQIDDLINYKWETFKFVNIIPHGQTTNQIQINLIHKGFKTNFSTINGANHKMLIKVVDPLKKAAWETPWMDACNATSPDAMFPVNGTRCVYGIFSNTEHRVCYIGSETENRAIFYIRVGIPRELDKIHLEKITLEPCCKIKNKKSY